MVVGFLGGLGFWFLRNHLGNKSRDGLKDEVSFCPQRRGCMCVRACSYGRALLSNT